MAAPRRARPAPGSPKTIEDLRTLLVGPEQTHIREVKERLDEHMDDMVGGVLPEAVVKSRSRGDALAWALEPLLETSIHDAVRRDPGRFAEAIAPAMGPAIRKAVRDALRVAMQRFNEALDNSLSVRSVRWRIEARRTGRPFSEVVLLRSLVYRVEQLFLIHRATGLVLEQMTADQIPGQDPDQIAAMLSAIERFTCEAFREDARLERFRVGALTGWVEHGPEALLVAVVRGAAPEDYEAVLRETLERTHLERARELADFRGDSAPFAATRELLSACLRESRRLPRPSWVAPLTAAAVLAAIVATLAVLGARASSRAERRFEAYAGALRGEPGLVLTEAKRRDGRYLFAGLCDPLAADPAAVLSRRGLDPAAAVLRFEPFYSLDPRLVERRAAAILHPPAGVFLALHDGTLEARGVAPERWIERARAAATMLPGVSAFAGERLRAEESIARAQDAARALERTELYFSPGSARLPAEQRALLDSVAGEAKRLFALAPEADLTVRIEVVGHADPTGSLASNQELATARAEQVAAELHARGIEGAVSARGGGVRFEVLPPGCRSKEAWPACPPGEDGRRARSVTFRVNLEQAATG